MAKSIKDLREEKGYRSAREFAEALGIAASSMSRRSSDETAACLKRRMVRRAFKASKMFILKVFLLYIVLLTAVDVVDTVCRRRRGRRRYPRRRGRRRYLLAADFPYLEAGVARENAHERMALICCSIVSDSGTIRDMTVSRSRWLNGRFS